MTELSANARTLIDAYNSWKHAYGDDIVVYSEGIFYAHVCTALTDEATDTAMAERPATGTRTGWTRSSDVRFSDGTPVGSPCEEHPDTRRHLLYEA